MFDKSPIQLKRVIVWFRQDLRLHDNEAFIDALHSGDVVIPVYVFDDRVLKGKTRYGFPKVGQERIRFLFESVAELRDNLRAMGSDLVIRTGPPEEVLFELARALKTSWIFCNRERTPEEMAVQDTLERQLWTVGQELRYSRGKMLCYTADLPYPVTHTPDHFKTFLKETERIVAIREPLPAPDQNLKYSEIVDASVLPDIEQYVDHAPAGGIRGGELAGLNRLEKLSESWIENGEHETDLLQGEPHLSPWLASGCLSPKRTYQVMSRATAAGNPVAMEVVNGLYLRDYLRLMVKKYGKSIFRQAGTHGEDRGIPEEIGDEFYAWATGSTGIKLVDAAMKQLNAQGYIPYALRNLAARCLIETLEVEWRLGASYFESKLIDYDPCSNWVNWCNIAGVGPDVKEERQINYDSQAARLDPSGTYVSKWLEVKV